MKFIAISTALAAALALAGCAILSRSGDPDPAPLAYAPASSAFVFGNTSTPPKAYAQLNARWGQYANTGIVQSLQRFQHMSAQLIGHAETEEQINAIVQLLTEQLSTPEGWGAIGVDVNARMALYEVNAMPVLRLELADKARFEAFVKDLETSTGRPFPRAEIDGQPFWHSPAPADAGTATRARAVMAIVGKHLVLTMDSQYAKMPLTAQLGLKKPTQSVIDTGAIAALNRQYGFQDGAASGYIDLQRLLALATDPAQSQSWIAYMLNASEASLDASCQAELGAIIAKAPRIVAGATQLLQPDLKLNVVWEFAPDLAKQWRALPAPVQGLDSSSRGNLVVGAGLNLSASTAFLQKQAAAIVAQPYQCERLQPLNDLAAKAHAGIGAVYAASSWVQGFRAQLHTWDLKTKSVTGTLLLASPNPSRLVNMAQSLLPQLAQLGLVAGGPAKQVELPESGLFSVLNQPTWAILGHQSVGFGLGAGMQADLEHDIQAVAPSTPPLLYFGSTGASIAELFNPSSQEDVEPPANSPQQQWQNFILRPINDAYSRRYKEIDYIDLQWLATERGFEFPVTVVVKPQQEKAQ